MASMIFNEDGYVERISGQLVIEFVGEAGWEQHSEGFKGTLDELDARIEALCAQFEGAQPEDAFVHTTFGDSGMCLYVNKTPLTREEYIAARRSIIDSMYDI